ncbi:MAG: hypothetical protein KBB11_06315 [Bacteroidales bacterium]|nr:hypothetical protein [Bacteroidales bacterium]HOY38922.1 hypothetical protein [Bacteroidales bacterium]HQN92576.1 hypothetical protein [Prolixibacteraceae bacterium]
MFLVFVAISTVLWFLNALEKEYSTTIDFVVKYENIPYNSMPAEGSPEKVSVSIRGHGYNLLKYKLSLSNMPVVIDFSEYKLSRSQNDKNNYFFRMANLSELFMKRFDNDIYFESISPDTLFFTSFKTEKKRVAVKPDLHYKLENQHKIAGSITLSPDSVTIYGSPVILKTIDSVLTESINLGVISSSMKKKVAIKTYDKVKIEPKSVNLEIVVEKCTEKTLSIPVNPINFPDTVNALFIPGSVDVTFNVSVENYDKIEASDFRLVADYAKSVIGVVPVSLAKTPASVSDVRLKKSEVHFIIEKK